MALLLVILGTTSAGGAWARSSQEIDASTQQQAQNCTDLGGTPDVYYDFDENGEILEAYMDCTGGGADGMWCQNTTSADYCTQGLVRPPSGLGYTGGRGTASSDGGASVGGTMIFNGGAGNAASAAAADPSSDDGTGAAAPNDLGTPPSGDAM
ncbi:MAG TPA: hypothetical protein VFQ80_03135 [Thermomicrobiales bacterium]|nr:hypothetical protein [Thermomicrobiales bacterium]